MYCWVPMISYSLAVGGVIAGSALGLFDTVSRDLFVGILGGLAVLATIRLKQYRRGYKELQGGEK